MINVNLSLWGSGRPCDWFRLWHELVILDRLVSMDDAEVVLGYGVVCGEGFVPPGQEIGADENSKVIPELIRIEGHGWCSWCPWVPIMIDATSIVLGGWGPAEIA